MNRRFLKYLMFQLVFLFKIPSITLSSLNNASFAPLFIANVSNSTLIIQDSTYSSLKISKKFTTFKPVLSQQLSESQNQSRAKADLRFGKVHAPGFNPIEYCKHQPNGFDCDDSDIFIPKFYYDLHADKCMTYYFGQCKGDLNKFDTLTDCYYFCSDAGKTALNGTFPASAYCKFQPDFGQCNDYQPKFYYDITSRNCKGFAYSGCGGNLNRFDSQQVCLTFCGEN